MSGKKNPLELVPKYGWYNNEGGSVIPTEEYAPKIPTYEEYYQQTLNSIEANRQKQVAGAAASAAQIAPTYGTRAERLNTMGLSGSGYSDYLAGKAYATGRQAISDINANAQAAQLEAKGLYTDYLAQQEANKINTFNTLMGNIGAYGSLADIKAIASANGITDSDMLDNLVSSRSGYIRNNLTGSQYTKKQLDDLYNNGNGELTETDYNALLKGIYDVSANDISSATFIDKDNGGAYLNYSKAKDMLDQFKAAFGEDSVQAKKMQAEFDKLYGVKTVGVTYSSGAGYNTGEGGFNFKVSAANGNKYKVEYSGNKGDDSVKQAAEGINDGAVFKYRGVLYIKRGTEVYEIKARPVNPNAYNNLLKLFE